MQSVQGMANPIVLSKDNMPCANWIWIWTMYLIDQKGGPYNMWRKEIQKIRSQGMIAGRKYKLMNDIHISPKIQWALQYLMVCPKNNHKNEQEL